MVSEKNGRQSWDHSPIKDKVTQKKLQENITHKNYTKKCNC